MSFLFPHPVGFLTGSLSSITQVLSATSTGSTITFPSGIQGGDLIVLGDFAENSSGTPTTVTPSGFTNIAVATAGIRKLMISFKKATGSESGSLTGMNGTNVNAKVMVVFRGDAAASTITSHDPHSEMTTGDPASQVVQSGSGIAPLVMVATYSNSSAVTSRPMSPAKDGEVGSSGDRCYVAWKIYNSAPANVTVDQTDIGVPGVISAYVQMS